MCSPDLPDLVVDHKEVEDSAYVEELSVDELDCARDEGCLSSSGGPTAVASLSCCCYPLLLS